MPTRPGASQLNGAHPASSRAPGAGAPAFFTEESLLRLEKGLRAQREQPEARFAQQAPAAVPAAPTARAAPAEHPDEQPVEAQGPARQTTSERVTAAQAPFEEADAASSRPRSLSGRQYRSIGSTQIDPTGENAQQAWISNPRRHDEGFSDSTDRPKIPTEEPVPSPSWRRRKVGFMLCALLIAVGAAALGVLVTERPGGSTDLPGLGYIDPPQVQRSVSLTAKGLEHRLYPFIESLLRRLHRATPINIEGRGQTASVPPDNDEPHQPMTTKSSAATPSQPLNNNEYHRPVTNAGESSAATQSQPLNNTNAGASSAATPSQPLNNNESHRPITNAGESSAATPSLPPLPRHRPTNNRRKDHHARRDDASDLPHARSGPRRVRGRSQGEAGRLVHDPEQDTGD